MKLKQNFNDFLKKLTIEKKKCCKIALIKTQNFSLEIFFLYGINLMKYKVN